MNLKKLQKKFARNNYILIIGVGGLVVLAAVSLLLQRQINTKTAALSTNDYIVEAIESQFGEEAVVQLDAQKQQLLEANSAFLARDESHTHGPTTEATHITVDAVAQKLVELELVNEQNATRVEAGFWWTNEEGYSMVENGDDGFIAEFNYVDQDVEDVMKHAYSVLMHEEIEKILLGVGFVKNEDNSSKDPEDRSKVFYTSSYESEDNLCVTMTPSVVYEGAYSQLEAAKRGRVLFSCKSRENVQDKLDKTIDFLVASEKKNKFEAYIDIEYINDYIVKGYVTDKEIAWVDFFYLNPVLKRIEYLGSQENTLEESVSCGVLNHLDIPEEHTSGCILDDGTKFVID